MDGKLGVNSCDNSEHFGIDEKIDDVMFLVAPTDMAPFGEALIGIAEQYHRKPIAVYNRNKIIEILAKDMSYEEAEEYFDYNIFQAWVGEQTPMFVSHIEEYVDDVNGWKCRCR